MQCVCKNLSVHQAFIHKKFCTVLLWLFLQLTLILLLKKSIGESVITEFRVHTCKIFSPLILNVSLLFTLRYIVNIVMHGILIVADRAKYTDDRGIGRRVCHNYIWFYKPSVGLHDLNGDQLKF